MAYVAVVRVKVMEAKEFEMERLFLNYSGDPKHNSRQSYENKREVCHRKGSRTMGQWELQIGMMFGDKEGGIRDQEMLTATGSGRRALLEPIKEASPSR